MKTSTRYRNAALILLISLSSLFALEFSFGGFVEGLFDNREFSNTISPSETFYGIRPTGFFTMHLNTKSSFSLGAHYFFQFGQEPGKGVISPIANYIYNDSSHHFMFGTIRRRKELTVPQILISDTYDIKNPILQGTFYQYHPTKKFSTALWIDWVGLISETQREQFLLGANLKYTSDKGLQLFSDFMYNHVSNTSLSNGDVQDYNAWLLYGGWQWKASKFKRIQHLSTGLLSIFEFSRNRQISMDYTTPWGIEAQAKILFNRFGFIYKHFHKISGVGPVGILPMGLGFYKEDYFDNLATLFYPLGRTAKPVIIEAKFIVYVTPEGFNHRDVLTATFPFLHQFGKKNYDEK